MTNYQNSSLWQQTLASRFIGTHDSYRNRLRAAYEIFWTRGTELAARISHDLPGLTLHDERHFAALWDRASQLTGPDYDINPLEAFVFGGAILLHDIGHAVAAYPGGLDEIKQTVEYRDAVVYQLRQKDGNRPDDVEITNPSEAVQQAALFVALRRLHAKHAENLANMSFGEQYLIDDAELRNDLGQVIGQVAASHQWNRVSLENKLRERQGAPACMPGEWFIQPIKLACLLRCADAIQIDQTRAPTFSFALHQPKGKSRLHWLAQRLGQPIISSDADGPGAVEFTSQNAFSEEDADAWWTAYDLIRTANDELQGCSQLMKSLDIAKLTVDRVLGAESPKHLQRYIGPIGWEPVNAEVRVTNVNQIVKLFGGQSLYGYDPVVPLRELIQNAADAIRARRHITQDDFYEGKILVTLKKKHIENLWVLSVEDNGTGMSEAILTGPLLEFGKSFWTSEEAQEEFPGLVSANLHQTGRYGIGFFSCLMISNHIIVTSRRYDAGYEKTRTLTFRGGLNLRPLLSKSDGKNLGQFLTKVELQISNENVERLLRVVQHSLPGSFSVNLHSLVAHICPCLDCDVYVRQDSDSSQLAHSRKWDQHNAKSWVRSIVYADVQADAEFDDYLLRSSLFMSVIMSQDGQPCGCAAIGFGLFRAGIKSIGGMLSGEFGSTIGNYSERFVGALPFEPDGPRRHAGASLKLAVDLQTWASNQALEFSRSEINEAEKYFAAINVAEFGGNPTPIAMIIINRELRTIMQVYELLKSGQMIIAPIEPVTRAEDSLRICNIVYNERPGLQVFLKTEEIELIGTVMESWRPPALQFTAYYLVPDETQPASSSFLSCLKAIAATDGYNLHWRTFPDTLVAYYRGATSERDKLLSGHELRTPALELSVTPHSKVTSCS